MHDPLFTVEVLAQTPNPQQLVWKAMHQDYSEDFVAAEAAPSERQAGKLVYKHLLSSNRGHYGPLEHPAINFSTGWFPHSVMQQARTHRVGVSFDVQSGRYTGERILKAAAGSIPIEEVFYLRPVGKHNDRHGAKFEYTQSMRNRDISHCLQAADAFAARVGQGMPFEQARGFIPFDFRQHFVVSFSLRALMHFLDLRAKKDAQPEIQALCDAIYPHFQAWTPEVAYWYSTERLHKARLAP